MRGVSIDTICHAPIAKMWQVTDSFCYQFQACPDTLFQWAYLGLEEAKPKKNEKRTKESRDVVHLEYKDRTYDALCKTGDVAIDIYVLGVRWWKDQHLGTQYTCTLNEAYSFPVRVHMVATYSGKSKILEGGDFILYMEPVTPTETRIHYEFNLTFGHVLSAFISDKTWRNSMEWRFRMILANLVECAETGTVTPKAIQ